MQSSHCENFEFLMTIWPKPKCSKEAPQEALCDPLHVTDNLKSSLTNNQKVPKLGDSGKSGSLSADFAPVATSGALNQIG